jgi:hypothetical protein
VDPIAEGEYYFHCDIHPNMNGTVVVGPPAPGEGGAPPPGPGEGGGSPSPPGGG